MLESPEPVDLKVLTVKGEVRCYEKVVGLKFDFYKGTRRIKFVRSGEVRQIRDALIMEINGMAVGL